VTRAGVTGKVVFTIVSWRGAADELVPVIAAWAEQRPAPERISILCNEDPDRAHAAAIERLLSATAAGVPVSVSSRPDNSGFAGGHNRLLAEAFSGGADVVVVANPDLVPLPGALLRLTEARVPGGSLRGPTLLSAMAGSYEPEGTIDSSGIRWTRTGRHLDARQGEPAVDLPDQPYRVPGISGACLYVPRLAYDMVLDGSGEFFDDSFLAYREDAELGLRADRLGVQSWIVPRAEALHVRSVRGTSRRGVSDHVNRLGVRNRFLIAFKYGTDRPGGWLGAPLRDALVLAGVVARERSSWPGLVEAWQLRDLMRAKGRRLRMSAGDRSRHAPVRVAGGNRG
jgi:GT2 family glycosyltransferase